MNRELDTVYFRAQRDGKWTNICFTDLTPQEAEEKLRNRSDEWLRSLYDILYDLLQEIEYTCFDPQDICHETLFDKMIKEIESYNSWTIKILMIRGFIRYVADKYDIVARGVEDE